MKQLTAILTFLVLLVLQSCTMPTEEAPAEDAFETVDMPSAAKGASERTADLITIKWKPAQNRWVAKFEGLSEPKGFACNPDDIGALYALQSLLQIIETNPDCSAPPAGNK